MKKFCVSKKKLPLFLLIGIFILCVGFILINCGKGPQGKNINPDSGQFAIDFTKAPSGKGAVFVVSSELLNRQGTEFTIEAWVKRKKDALNGAVFSRHDSKGILMWVKDNEPKFAMRRVIAGTSTDFDVESGFSFGADKWHHMAGVLVNAVHSHPTSSSCTTAVMAETPHLDIYVDGEFKNCATTWGAPGDTATGPQFLPDLSTCPPDPITGDPTLGAGVCAGDTLGIGIFVGSAVTTDGTSLMLNGVIDEVRYWTVARTPGEINACRNTELSLGGVCSRNNPNLAAYLRFNEGKGSSPADWTGLGSGSKEDALVSADDPARVWDSGWVSGAPITKKD